MRDICDTYMHNFRARDKKNRKGVYRGTLFLLTLPKKLCKQVSQMSRFETVKMQATYKQVFELTAKAGKRDISYLPALIFTPEKTQNITCNKLLFPPHEKYTEIEFIRIEMSRFTSISKSIIYLQTPFSHIP